MNMFQYNEFGVCVNPKIAADVRESNSYVTIRTACVKGKWSFGIMYGLPDRGGSFGVNLSNSEWFSSEQQAIEAASKWIKGWLLRQIKEETNLYKRPESLVCKQANKLLKGVDNLLPKQQYVQLELF